MQKNLSLLLACAVAVLLAICLLQAFEVSDQKTQLSGLRDVVSSNGRQIKTLQATIKRMDSRRADYTKEIKNLAEQNSALASQQKKLIGAPSTPPPQKGSPETSEKGVSGMLTAMLKDPEFKKTIESQQKQVLKTMYGPLSNELKLSPAETEKFNELLLTHQMQNMDSASELMSNEGNKSQATENMKTAQATFETQLREFLGEDRFAQYQDYTQTMPDRMTLNAFTQQLSGNSLTEQQRATFLQILKEERTSAGLPDTSKAENFNLLTSSGGLDRFVEQQNAINARVYARATEILTPEQLQSFGTFQTNQADLQQMGLKMAQKMWGSKTNNASQ